MLVFVLLAFPVLGQVRMDPGPFAGAFRRSESSDQLQERGWVLLFFASPPLVFNHEAHAGLEYLAKPRGNGGYPLRVRLRQVRFDCSYVHDLGVFHDRPTCLSDARIDGHKVSHSSSPIPRVTREGPSSIILGAVSTYSGAFPVP